MPRVQGMDTNQRRRKDRGIFSLSTPFQNNNSTVAAASKSSSSPFSMLTNNNRNNKHVNNTHDQRRSQLDDMEFCGSIQEDDEMIPVKNNNCSTNAEHRSNIMQNNNAMMMEEQSSSKSMTAIYNNELSAAEGNNIGQKSKDGMAKFDDDSDVTTINGDEEDESVDLLADDKSNDNDGRIEKKNDNHQPQQEEMQNNDNNAHQLAASMLSPISPATQTLDRLSMFGSQEGGAELCIERVLQKNAEDYNNRNQYGGEECSIRKNQQQQEEKEKEQCIQDLKEYFMSTKNSAVYAQQQSNHLIPPTVPFCHKCKAQNQNNNSNNNPSSPTTALQQSQQQSQSTITTMLSSLIQIPHHGLCPQHLDFYISGSYEILNLIVDGNILGCEACIDQFIMGRPNKQLVHVGECKRGGGGGNTKKKNKNKVGSSGSGGGSGKKRGNNPTGKNGREMKKSMSSPPMLGSRKSSTAQLTPPPTTAFGQHENVGAEFEVGTIVYVEDRMWPGRNDPGGVARVVTVNQREGNKDRTYDVKYVLEQRKEKGVEEDFMSLHTDYVSPSKDYSTLSYEDDSQKSEVAASASMENNNNAAVNNNQTASSPESPALVDANGHPLSEYERLRLRNIKRNKARLAHLGLLVPPTRNNGNDQSSSSATAKQGRPKKSKKAKQHEVERRSQPKRQRPKQQQQQQSQEEDGKPRATTKGNTRQSSHKVSLAEAAQSGCKKCIAELETGVKDNRSHNVNCPLSTSNRAPLAEAAKSGCRKCIAELETGEKKDGSSHDQGCPRKKKGKKKESGKDAIEHQRQMSDKVEEDDLGYLDRRMQLPTNNSVPTLVDAAKAGCRKCTMEWQTEEVDTTMSHDICCPRVGKRAPSDKSSSSSSSRQKQTFSKSNVSTSGTGGRSLNSRSHSASSSSSSTNIIKAKARNTSQRVYQPTPSPVPVLASTQRPPQLPAWIRDFISEANEHNEKLTIPRASKWLPCPNPWGKIGHEEGDFVIMSPFESESASDMIALFHQGPNGSMPKRFVANPLEEGSPYHATHRSPARGGYSVLRLTRDRMSLRPWGFTVRLHEFGGACLVDSIEPSSPAEAAKDISGWTTDGSSYGLKLHDMIICINGKSVGSMTMPELIIELDVCGPEMMLVVSRFDIKESVAGGKNGLTTLEDLAMDWNDVGTGGALKRKRVSFENYDNCSRFDQHAMEGQTPLRNHYESTEIQLDDDAEREYYDASESEEVRHVLTKNDLQLPVRKMSNTATKQSHKRISAGPKRHAMESDREKEEDSHDDEPTDVQKSSKEVKNWPLRGISKPGNNDYLSGRGHRKSHSGNVKFNQIIDDNKATYDGLSRGGDKGTFCMKIVKDWRSLHPQGRFLKLNDRTKLWDDIGDEEAKGKVMMAFVNKTRVKSCSDAQSEEARDRNYYGQTVQKRTQITKATSRYQKNLEEEFSDDESEVFMPKRTTKRGNTIRSSIHRDDDEDVSSEDEQWKGGDGDGDEDPWLGCVCGNTHPHPIKVFWIQCESCDAWYNVAEECVGFDANAAEQLDEWRCWACDPPVAGLGL